MKAERNHPQACQITLFLFFEIYVNKIKHNYVRPRLNSIECEFCVIRLAQNSIHVPQLESATTNNVKR